MNQYKNSKSEKKRQFCQIKKLLYIYNLSATVISLQLLRCNLEIISSDGIYHQVNYYVQIYTILPNISVNQTTCPLYYIIPHVLPLTILLFSQLLFTTTLVPFPQSLINGNLLNLSFPDSIIVSSFFLTDGPSRM